MRKVYVSVTADFDARGRITPLSFIWDDDRRFEIDKVLDRQRSASRKVGGVGWRYTVRVCGKETHLWLEDDGKWFMEGK
ncbi:MAG: hypothetical protein ABF449_10680 [Ethanoligenens sp.]